MVESYKQLKVGFLGTGNMASAIITGIVKTNFIAAEQIYLFSRSMNKVRSFAEKIGAQVVNTPEALVEAVDVLILGVKPKQIHSVLLNLKPAILKNKPLLVSLAAGITTDVIYTLFSTREPLKIMRVMPNINVMVGEGAAAVCGNCYASQNDFKLVVEMFTSIGKVWELDEKNFIPFAALAGSSPAFIYLFIDSIARAGVKNGLPKDLALEMTTQAVLGSAKMLMSTNENPWTLIDRVCSPGGTTVAGFVELENHAFIATVIKGIEATIQKDQELSE